MPASVLASISIVALLTRCASFLDDPTLGDSREAEVFANNIGIEHLSSGFSYESIARTAHSYQINLRRADGSWIRVEFGTSTWVSYIKSQRSPDMRRIVLNADRLQSAEFFERVESDGTKAKALDFWKNKFFYHITSISTPGGSTLVGSYVWKKPKLTEVNNKILIDLADQIAMFPDIADPDRSFPKHIKPYGSE